MTGSSKAITPPDTVDDIVARQREQDLLRFITCGSVDDGKSTLIGRLLWESSQIFEDQLAALESDSRRFGTQGAALDFALLVDGLAAEREQGITIDVAYRYFSTPKRKFIVADTPGHEQYTRNMVTGASTADVAILLVDARKGLMTQTRRHAFLASLTGIRHVALAVNKMDLTGYDKDAFVRIDEAFRSFAEPLAFDSITTIPMSALQGENMTKRSSHTPWYHGPTLMGYLETVDVSRRTGTRFVFPVQWVSRPHADFRGYSGTVAEGIIRTGERVRVSASGQLATVAEIVTMDGLLPEAAAGDAVTVKLDREIDVSRGDVLSAADQPLQMTDQFEATIVWLAEESGLLGRSYDIKLSSQWASASITNIKHRIDVVTLGQVPARQLDLNDICTCNLATTKPLAFDTYADCRELGSFILVDRFSHATVAAGMIRHNLRRAQNVHQQALSIRATDRARLNGHRPLVVWFTGLSGAGKSHLANALEVALHARGMRTYILDGDNVRKGLNKDLGFTETDRVENIRRIAEVSKLMADAGLVVLTSFISPFERERQMARELIGPDQFLEVYVSTPLEVCEKRDVKGLYRLARAGKIPNMTGINSPYEPPTSPDYTADGSTTDAAAIVAELEELVCAATRKGPQ